MTGVPYLSELLQRVGLAREPAFQRGALALQGRLSLHALSRVEGGQISQLSWRERVEWSRVNERQTDGTGIELKFENGGSFCNQ